MRDNILEREKKREQFRRDALAAWSNYQATGLPLTSEEADAWLAELESGKNVAHPKCHTRRVSEDRSA
jgi:predicted transcriptional regulator